MAKKKPKGRVGIIGLGIMGGAFARNLMKNGWHVVGYDIDPKRRRELAKAGVDVLTNAAAVATSAPIIITTLPKPEALHAVAAEIAAAKLPKRIVVEASTFTLDDKLKAQRVLNEAGHVMLDCPVSGTGAQAKTGDIVIYASGDRAAIRRLKPLFAAFSRATHDLGVFGNGSKMKYVANLLVAIHNVASAEAMVLGMKSGLAPDTILKFATSGVGNSRILELRGPMMVKNRYDEPTMKIGVWQKDMQVIGDFARAIGVATPLFDATMPVYDEAMASGHAMDDTAAVCAVLEEKSGVKRKRGK